MLGVLIQIDGWDPVAGAAVTLRMASHDDPALCMLNAQTWWPVLATLPVMRYDYFDGAFAGQIEAPSSSFSCSTAPWANFGRYALADARVRVWTGNVGAAWGAFTLRFDGRATAQPQISGGIAQVDFAVDDRWLDDPLLPTYAGTGGAEGPAALKGVAKPLALGSPRYVPGVLIDAVENIWQVSGAGVIESVEFALDRLVRLPAPAADAASYAALVSLTVANGQVATALSAGLVKHGAPAAGKTSYLVKGDKAGPDGWARTPGKVIRRLALLSGGAGKIADASLNALDTARPYNLSLYLGEQTTARGEIQALAAGVNAVAGVSWLGELWADPIGFGARVLTLAADGTALPPVASVRQIGQAAPFWRMTLGAERTWSVHGDGDYTAIDIWPAGAFTLINVANCEITTPNSVTKVSGGSAWDGKAYTREAMTGASVSWVIGGAAQGGGLTTDPTANSDYATIDYLLYAYTDNKLYVARDGADGGAGAGPTWAAGDVATVTCREEVVSGARQWWLRYYLNGAEINAFAHQATAPAERLHAVFEIFSQGQSITDISFASTGAAGADGASSAGTILNPAFETGSFANWTPVPNSGAVTLQSAVARSGTYAARIQLGSPTAPYILSNKWPCTEGQKWQLSAWVKRDEAALPSNPAYLYAIFYNAAGAQNNDALLTSVSHTISGWQLLTGEVTVPAGSPQMSLDVGEATGSGAWFVDDAFATLKGGPGADGLNNAVVKLYKRGATVPSAPTGTFTFTFATNVLSGGTFNGWTQAEPAADGNPKWVIAASASANTATDSIPASEFSAPVLDTGAGVNTATVRLHKRGATAPALPTGTFTYTFATGVLSGGTLNGWTQAIPATDGNPLYFIQATASAPDATDNIPAGEFSAAAVLVQDGAPGTNAKTLTVLSDRQTISYDAAGAASPTTQTTTFSTNKQNTTGTVNWSVTDAAGVARTPTTSFLSSTTGDSVTMTEAQFASARNGTSGVIVTGSITDGTTFSDKISVVRVQAGAPGTDGVSPVNVTITPPAVSVQLNADGTASGLPINFLVKAQQGGSAISVTSVTITAETGADFSVSRATVRLDTWNGGATEAQATLTVVAGGQTITGVILPVSTAKAGAGVAMSVLTLVPTITQANAATLGQVGGNLAVNASSTGKLKLNLSGYLRPDIEDYRYDWQIEYSTNGGSSWTAVAGMPITSGFTTMNLQGNIVGGFTLTTGPYTVTGLGNDQPCLVRVLLRKHAGDPSGTAIFKTNLTLSAEQVA